MARCVRLLLVSCALLGLCRGALCAAPGAPEYAPGQVVMSLEEYLAQSAEAWFLAGKRAYAVQAMMVSGEITFHNALEAADYTVVDDGDTVVLKGKHGEMWASKLPEVLATYTRPDGSPLGRADFARKDSYIEIVARSDPEAYCALHVPPDISVTVETAWGDVLHANLPNAPHGEGDYIVCRADADKAPDLSDVWILNGLIFLEYYEASQ